MTTAFYVRKYKQEATIWLRISYKRGTPFRKSIGEKIPVNAWDSKKQKVKDLVTTSSYASKINKRLELIAEKYDKETKGEDINEALLENIWIRIDEKKSKTFTEFCDSYYKWIQVNIHPKTKRPYAKETIKKYEQTIKKFKEFQDKEYEVNFKGLDKNFHTDFINYFKDQGLAENSIAVFIKYLKVMAKQAKDNHPVNPFILSNDFYLPSNETYDVYCTIDEIRKIKDWKATSESLDNVRNWFIFGCWTGLRVSDWHRVENIDSEFIEITPLKTKATSGKAVVIPLHPWVKELPTLRNISEQKFNEYIKKVARKAGITDQVYGSKMVNVNENEEENAIMRRELGYYPKWQLISSHTCRRSFATNNYLLDMPTLDIMQITGHTTEKNFLKYIKVTPKQHARKMAEVWNKHF
ncbi:tyrosine-type recombinase/integrase [Christiangramia crocea]|uniref:Site-specific integrase n=1 Tax=Christiangramia crocea TaxID=2904124 RepID=A0A9X2A512_9FLAO|nr:phage integrase SAM-like domain-containing protein [Gramella crocea]MCG9971039.1 site-specific integrase [Gramella crocea]